MNPATARGLLARFPMRKGWTLQRSSRIAQVRYPFSNVYEDERVCTGNNILPRYKKLSAMKNFPRYLLGLPDNDDMFYSAHNQKGLDHKALLEHLKDKDPSYYYTDILVPNGRTLSDFILRR